MVPSAARVTGPPLMAASSGGQDPLQRLPDHSATETKATSRSAMCGYSLKMHRADAEKILAAELAAINGRSSHPSGRRDHHIWQWDEEFLHPHARRQLAGRDAPRPTSTTSTATSIRPSNTSRSRRHQVSGADAAQPAGCGRVLVHGRLSCARSDQSCLGGGPRTRMSWSEMSPRKTVIPEIEESDKPGSSRRDVRQAAGRSRRHS